MAQRIASQSPDAVIRDRFPVGESLNFFFYFLRVLTNKQWGRQQNKEILWWDVGKRCFRKEGEGTCENPVRLSMYDGAMEAVDYMWVNIWCMLHAKLDCWILSQSCRNTRPRENTFSSIWVSNPRFRRYHNHHATACYRVTNFNVFFNLLLKPRADPGHIALPSRCTRHFCLPHYALGFSRINLHDTNHGT